MEYKVETIWSGWWGGYGREQRVARQMKEKATDGWRLLSVTSQLCVWWLLPIPIPLVRPRIMLVFERETG